MHRCHFFYSYPRVFDCHPRLNHLQILALLNELMAAKTISSKYMDAKVMHNVTQRFKTEVRQRVLLLYDRGGYRHFSLPCLGSIGRVVVTYFARNETYRPIVDVVRSVITNPSYGGWVGVYRETKKYD